MGVQEGHSFKGKGDKDQSEESRAPLPLPLLPAAPVQEARGFLRTGWENSPLDSQTPG